MRKVLFFLLFLFSFNFLYSQNEDEGKPQATVEETTHEMGDVLKGTKVEYSFIIKNTGTAPLKIFQARPS